MEFSAIIYPKMTRPISVMTKIGTNVMNAIHRKKMPVYQNIIEKTSL
jgi:hypothetical protein